jgi:hypothetical protein
MTRKQGNILAAVLLGLGLFAVILPLLAALPWILFPLKGDQSLRYSDGVTFHHSSDGRFTAASWMADDWDLPGTCPLTVHLPRGDFGAAELTLDRLRREAWTEKEVGLGIDVYAPGRVVECHFRNGALTHLHVDGAAAEAREIEPVALSYKGTRVELPTTGDAIKGALGAPRK